MDLFSVADDYGAWDVLRSAGKKNRRNFWGPVPLDRLHLFFYGLCPSAELHNTNCVPDFCCFFFSAELLEASAPWSLAIFFTDYVFFCFSAELHYTNYAPDICWFFFQRNLEFRPMVRRNSTSQNVSCTFADSMVFPRISAGFFFFTMFNIVDFRRGNGTRFSTLTDPVLPFQNKGGRKFISPCNVPGFGTAHHIFLKHF